MKTLRFPAILEGDKDGCYAYYPELKGRQTQRESVHEALANLRKAAELYLETLSTEELDGKATNPRTIPEADNS